jgi:hypothetical protein
MPKPDMDEDFLLSPSSPAEKKGPEDEVRETVSSLLCSKYLNPVVGKFLQDSGQKDLFLEAFARQANLIKSRCQSFDDGHVTVYDKVLLSLTDNGNRFDSVAAQEYFCEEFLGISRDGNPTETGKILQQNLVLKAILARGKDRRQNHISQGIASLNSHFCQSAAYPEGKYCEKYSPETNNSEKGQLRPPSSAAPENKEDDRDAKIARLMSVYEKAKSDFEAVAAGDTVAKLSAARFLRDTAENTIMYFRDRTKLGDDHAAVSDVQDLIADLESTCKMAQASVVSLSGGRKRKFDKHDYEVLPRISQGRGDHAKFSRRANSSSGCRGRRVKNWQESQGDFRSMELPSQRSDSSAREPGPHRPFGYSRPVDSYQPGHDHGHGAGGSSGSHSHAHPYQHQPHYAETSNPALEAYGYERGGQRYHSRDTTTQFRVPQEYSQRGFSGHGYGYVGYGDGGGQVQNQQELQRYDLEPAQESEGAAATGRGYHHQQQQQSGSRASRSYRLSEGGGRGSGAGGGGGYQPSMGY